MALLDEIQVRVYRSSIKIPLIFFVPALTLLSIYSLTYFYVNTPHFWDIAEEQLHHVLGGQYELGYAQVGPDLTSVNAYDVELMTSAGDPVIEASSVEASLDPLMLLAGRVEFDRGVVEGVKMRLEYQDGSLNLLDALGVTERQRQPRPEDRERRAVGFSDIDVRDAQFEFADERFGFSVDEVNLPDASVFVEPATVLMAVDQLTIPEADFWFEPELFRFPSERGRWEFTARDFEIDDWRWANDGFTVEQVMTEVDGIELEASGRMSFPGGDVGMLYDAEGSVRAAYHSEVLEYFTGGNIRFGIANADVEVAGDSNQIQGGFYDVYAPAIEASGVQLDHLRGDIELDNRLLIADEVTGEFYGGEFTATNTFFNMLDRVFGADAYFQGVNPRGLMGDITNTDQVFLDGQMGGGLRIAGEIPREARAEPMEGYPLAHDAMARYATMEVIEPLVWQRHNDELFPNERVDLLEHSQFWIDQRRLGLQQATARSGRDRFDIDDFILAYQSLMFERADGSGPATIRGRLEDVGPYATYYGLDGLEGGAEFTMSMEQFFGSPSWRLDAAMDAPYWRFNDDTVLGGDELQLQLAGDEGDIEIVEAFADTEFGRFEATGHAGWYQPPPADGDEPPWPIWEDRVEQPLDLEVTARNLETAVISDLIHPELRAEGALDADIELSGTYQALEGGYSMELTEGTVREQPVRYAEAAGQFEPQGVQVDDAHADLGQAGVFEGSGAYRYDGDFVFDLEGDNVDLAELRELDEMPMRPGGRGHFYMDGLGSVDEPKFSGGGQIRDFALDERVYGDVAVAADTLDGTVQLSGGLLPWLTATVELPLEGPAPYSLRFGMEELELMDFLPELEDHPVLDDALVTGEAQVFFERDFSRHQIIFELSSLDIDSKGQQVSNLGDVVIGYNNGEVITFERASFASGGHHFTLEGGMGLENDLLDIRVEGDMDLGLLDSARAQFPDFFPEWFVDAEGYANTDLNIRGTPENLVADGTIGFGPSQWSVRFLPEPIAVESGRMNLDDRGIEIPENEPLDGTMLGGATRVAGEMGYLEHHPRRMDMQMWSHNMSYRIPALMTLAFDTNLRLTASDWQDFETWLVQGNVDILDGVYHQEFNVVEQEIAGRVIGAFQPQTERYEAGLLEAVPILNDIEFDMNLRARDGFRFQSQVDRLEADLEFRFDLLLQDTFANPRVTGDLDVLDGDVSFQGEAFEVRSGTISFNEDVSNPHLDIEAGADVRNTCEQSEFVDEVSPAMTLTSNIDTGDAHRPYHIMLNLQGELENMSVQLDSNPHADERDILSLLLTGCTVDQLTATGASRPTLEVALGPLLGRLEREIADVVAVDELTITPGVERTQVRISDNLTRRLNWRFHLDTGFADASGGQQTQLELKLSDNWSAELSERSYEETDDFLIDLKLNYRLPLD